MTENFCRKSSPDVGSLADNIFEQLALQFPVCMSSDEFHYFPQARVPHPDWARWDDFSPEALQDLAGRISHWEQELREFEGRGLPLEEEIDVNILRRVIRTIYEQVTAVAPQRTQPTFYLTILGIGLAEAVETGSRAVNARMRGLPRFLDQARRNLREIPVIFRDQGCEMILKLKPWLRSFPLPGDELGPVIASLDHLSNHLNRITTSDEFLLPVELYERIAFHHMGCFMPTHEIGWELDREIVETGNYLRENTENIAPGRTWQEIIANLPHPELPPGGIKQLYLSMIHELADHCREVGLATPDFIATCPAKVEEIPDYMLPVRSNAAYSMPPGYPPTGGTFFIMENSGTDSVSRDYRLLTAHETYPGHHLLDSNRWSLRHSVRRHIEFPIFYEGWASFSEELLFDTGFFSSPIDCILLAKRRFWRAMRGRVDLDVHTRKRNLEEAAAFLFEQGMERDRATAMVRRYIQKPGYQLAYTTGRRRFRGLYDRYMEKNRKPVRFAARILAEGEIGFDHLENILLQGDNL